MKFEQFVNKNNSSFTETPTSKSPMIIGDQGESKIILSTKQIKPLNKLWNRINLSSKMTIQNNSSPFLNIVNQSPPKVMRRKSIQTKSYTYVQTVQAFDWYFDEFELDDQRSLQDKIEFL